MQKFADVVTDRKGNVVPTATVQVKTLGGGPVTIYSTNAIGTPAANPIQVNNLGQFEFYAANGRYSLEVYIGSALFAVRTDVLLEDPADATPEVIDGGTFRNGALENVTIDGEAPVTPAQLDSAMKPQVSGDANKGPGSIPYNSGLSYPSGSIGKALKDAAFDSSSQLRADLANSSDPAKGVSLSGYKGRNLSDFLGGLPSPLDAPFSAIGNGIVDDTAAFVAFESAVSGRTVDLGGRTYVVTSRPTKNSYINGKFKVLNATFSSDLYNGFLTGVPKFTPYGNQLRNLKEALGNPLVQVVGIVAVGDSITWGRTLPDNSSVSPQTQLLTTARDNASSPSFWNNFRRYIGERYMGGATPNIYNWEASPSGQSVVEYTRAITIYPKDGPFSLAVTGASQSVLSAARPTSPTGYMYTLMDGNPGGSSYQSISFNYTGDQFTLILRATNTGDFNNYDLIVDGVNRGTFTTQDGVDGIVSGDNNRRTHTFPYVRNKVVTIRTNSTGLTGVRRLYIEGLEIPKFVQMINQGVIGQTARTYDLYNLSGSYSNPTAVPASAQFIFCQFGTNDRGDTSVPPGAGEFERSMQAIVNRLTPLGDVILMCAGPLSPSIEPPTPVSMTMQDVRGVINRVARVNNLAFIDNLAAFDAVDPAVILDGTTHPNALGHAIISRNIINSFES